MHDWSISTASPYSGPQKAEVIVPADPKVVAVCRKCGDIRTASIRDPKIDLSGNCDPGGKPQVF